MTRPHHALLRVALAAICLSAGGCVSVSSTKTSSQSSPAPTTHEPYGSEMKEFNVHNGHHLEWKSGPASLPPGAQVTVLEGDPTKEGPFVIRLKLPDGFTIPPHWHPRAERLTVISGTFNIAMGETIDKSKGTSMPAGSFGYWPARMPHFAWAAGETTIQLHGHGPWAITYLNPADDPRNAKKN